MKPVKAVLALFGELLRTQRGSPRIETFVADNLKAGCGCVYCSIRQQAMQVMVHGNPEDLANDNDTTTVALDLARQFFELQPPAVASMARNLVDVAAASVVVPMNTTALGPPAMLPKGDSLRALFLQLFGEPVFSSGAVNFTPTFSVPQLAAPKTTINVGDQASPKETQDMNQTNGAAAIAVVKDNGTVDFKNTRVVREGEKIILAKDMTCDQAIETLQRQKAEDERTVAVNEEVNAFVFEGAVAFHKALSRKFGWVDNVPTPGFFGSPPMMIGVEVGPNETMQVPWGRVQIPGITGYLESSVAFKNNRFYFSICGEVKQKHRQAVQEIVELTREIAKAESIYRGRALRLALPKPKDVAFSPTNCPSFIDIDGVNPEELIFADDVGRMVETALFNPVECTEVCREQEISLKRGTLLAGTYGVGKSLTAAVLAKKCTENGWTYFYVTKASDVALSYRLAAQYEPAVLFVEDIDQVTSGEERTDALNEILNTIDGIDSKSAEVMVVFTTNHADNINKAMMRAGRLDYVINITPPDQSAVQRLIALYTRGHLAVGADLAKVGELLQGQIPATLREVCSRAQLSSVRHMKPGDKLTITADDLEVAAISMLQQLDLTSQEPEEHYEEVEERAADILGTHLREGIQVAVEQLLAPGGGTDFSLPRKQRVA